MSIPQPRSQDESGSTERTGSGSASGPVALPRMLTPFFGRDQLVRRVVDRVRDREVRLLTLTGPGGVGKTRLALRAAEVARPAFADGCVFVPLGAVVDPALVLPAITGAIGVTATGERPIGDRLIEALGGRAILLVLDNLEQVLAAAPQLAGLLHATGAVTVLATSRAPLHIEGECELSVPALTLPRRGAGSAGVVGDSEAVHFFLERARAVQPDLRLTPAGWEAVHEIVRRLDGLPLALELAAARMKVLSAEALLVRLERQLHVLTGGPQDRPARQRTMREAVAWSYGLLAPAERALFRQLSVFRGAFTLDDAELILAGDAAAIAGDPTLAVFDGVAALADQSLLTTVDTDNGDVRFRMLEPIREFGLEQLAIGGEADDVRARFADHWRSLAEETWTKTAELDALDEALAPLERNQDNVRAALDWLEEHDPARAAALAGGLSWFWYVRGHHAEALRRVRRLLAFPDSVVPGPLRPRLLLAAGWNAHFQGDTEAAIPYLEEALARWRAEGNEWGIGYSLLSLGVIAEDTGAYDRARPLLSEAIARLTAADDAGSVATARYHLAVVAFGDGDLRLAESLLREALGSRHGSSVRIAGWALHLRGLVTHRRGDDAAALRDQQEALRRFRHAHYASGLPEALAGVAVAVARTRPAMAARLWAVAERRAGERGDPFQSPERAVYEEAVARLRTGLGDMDFQAEIATGRALPEEEAVALALALDVPAACPPRGAPPRGEAGSPRAQPPARGAPPSRIDRFSPREREVLRLVGWGWTSDRIAEELYLSPRTVQTHLSSIFRKIDVGNRAEAVRVAVEAGLT